MSTDDIVPEGFDLEEAHRRRSTTPREERERCPYCESTRIWKRQGDRWDYPEDTRRGSPPENDERCSCRSCGGHFDDPLVWADEE